MLHLNPTFRDPFWATPGPGELIDLEEDKAARAVVFGPWPIWSGSRVVAMPCYAAGRTRS
jgi:hypothetical protein